MAKAAKDAGRSYAIYPVPMLLAEIKRTFDRDSGDNYLAFFRAQFVDVLVLDDLGAEKQTEWVLEQLYSIVNERWQDRSIVVTDEPARSGPGVRRALLSRSARPARRRERGATHATSTSCACCLNGSSVSGEVTAREVAGDLDPIARLRKQIGSRTVSRLMEICDDPIPIQGPDLRMAAQAPDSAQPGAPI